MASQQQEEHVAKHNHAKRSKTTRSTIPITATLPATWMTSDIKCLVKLDLKPCPAIRIAETNIIKLLEAQDPRWASVNKFKIGLTGEPTQRWFSGRKAPYCRNWDTMFLLHACASLEAAKYLECILIEKFWDYGPPRLFNNREYNDFGGTGRAVDHHGLFYVYLLVLDCGKPPEYVHLLRTRPYVDQQGHTDTDTDTDTTE